MSSWERKARWIGRAGAALIGALGVTWRARVVGGEHLAACRAGGGFIHAFWHGQLLPLVYLKRSEGIVVLVSQNRDGEYITQVIHRHGFRTVRGSTSRGGFRSLIEMVRLGKAGAELAITPDGPRGPRHEAQPGLLLVAQRAGIPILPMAVAARPCRRLASWDRFLIPWPGARAVIVYGPPIVVPAELATEALLAEWTPRVNEALLAVTASAEREVAAGGGRRDTGRGTAP
jgi:lysophospholipid acyltransferase (LPLAT)-like uncharacterized protein